VLKTEEEDNAYLSSFSVKEQCTFIPQLLYVPKENQKAEINNKVSIHKLKRTKSCNKTEKEKSGSD
jgi:ABC-type proline/glycine betaine transport system ATPase subunit